MITLEEFFSGEECERLINLGSIDGYQRSKGSDYMHTGGGVDKKFDDGRTRSHAWCARDECSKHPATVSVSERIVRLTGIP
jgi:hypothetical protein